MDIVNALTTTATALANARNALKPAICDLAATDAEYELETIMRTYLNLRTAENRTHKTIHGYRQSRGDY